MQHEGSNAALRLHCCPQENFVLKNADRNGDGQVPPLRKFLAVGARFCISYLNGFDDFLSLQVDIVEFAAFLRNDSLFTKDVMQAPGSAQGRLFVICLGFIVDGAEQKRHWKTTQSVETTQVVTESRGHVGGATPRCFVFHVF